MNKQELIEEITKSLSVTKDYNKVKHIFSDDEGEKTLSDLNRSLKRVLMLLELQKVKEIAHPENKAIQPYFMNPKGGMVSIRPCAEQYENKTFLGFLIGSISLESSFTILEDKIQLNYSGHNPAIFVPELNKVIYGCESWWGEIKDVDDFKQITDKTIQSQWYVKLWKDLIKQ